MQNYSSKVLLVKPTANFPISTMGKKKNCVQDLGTCTTEVRGKRGTVRFIELARIFLKLEQHSTSTDYRKTRERPACSFLSEKFFANSDFGYCKWFCFLKELD